MSDYRLIPLHGKYGEGKFAKVSPEDFEWLSSFRWHVSKGYALSEVRLHGVAKKNRMHRLVVFGTHQSENFVDHKNQDTLDNRRSNLRPCNFSENMQNSTPQKGCLSKFKGVTWNKNRRAWQATIHIQKSLKNLGYYDLEKDAARAYDAAARFYFESFARTNFSDGPALSISEIRGSSRQANLRAKNCTSHYLGVHRKPKSSLWFAKITSQKTGKKRQVICCKAFAEEVEAALYYDTQVKILNLNRPLNFPG